MLDPKIHLSGAEIAVLRRFAARRAEFLPADAEVVAYRIVAPLARKLNLRFTPGQPPRYAALASLLARATEDDGE